MGGSGENEINAVVFPSGLRGVEVWRKPDKEELKCNVNAMIFAVEGCYGIDMCLKR